MDKATVDGSEGDLDPRVQEILDRREVEVTRAVTAAVTADLARGFDRALAERDARIRELVEELDATYQRLDEVEREVDRIRSHPAVQGVRLARRATSALRRRATRWTHSR